jgi:hypothetical protein
MTVALLTLLVACEGEPAPQHIEVVRGDTLSKLASARGCTVDQLRAWNGIEGDLIEVGQRLAWFPEQCTGAAAAAPASRPRKPKPKPQPARGGFELPPEKPCLAGPDPDGVGDEGIAASEGLTQAQASRALSEFVHHVLPCIGDASPTDALELELVVACTGRVSSVRVAARHDWPADVAACVTETLRFAPFPAHGLPDGDVVRYPLRYTPAE